MRRNIIDKKTTAEKFNQFFANIGPKVASKILVSNTHFDQYVKYEGPNLEDKKKELFNEELKNVFSSLKSNKSPRYDDISSNIIRSVTEETFGVLKIRAKSFSQS